MAEYGAASVQTVNPGESIIFTETLVPCESGLVRHRDGSGSFLLSGWAPYRRGCCCRRNDSAEYLVYFGANIAVPTGGTAGEISVAIAVGGSTLPTSTMIVTPAAVEEYDNVSRTISVPIWRGCCETVTIRNTSDQTILVLNPGVKIDPPGLHVTR